MPLGIIAAVRQNKIADRVASAVGYDAAGIFVWEPPGETGIAIRRIVVSKDNPLTCLSMQQLDGIFGAEVRAPPAVGAAGAVVDKDAEVLADIAHEDRPAHRHGEGRERGRDGPCGRREGNGDGEGGRKAGQAVGVHGEHGQEAERGVRALSGRETRRLCHRHRLPRGGLFGCELVLKSGDSRSGILKFAVQAFGPAVFGLELRGLRGRQCERLRDARPLPPLAATARR